MKKYRLKKEAVPFFHEKHATSIHDSDYWDRIGVDEKALEVVEEAYVSFGHKTGDNSSSLSGWSEKDGAKFLFTIHFPSVKYREHDVFSKGKPVRELMNRIQQNVNRFYQEFVNEKE